MDAYKKRQIMHAGLNLWKKFFFLRRKFSADKKPRVEKKQQKCLDVQSIEGDRRIER